VWAPRNRTAAPHSVASSLAPGLVECGLGTVQCALVQWASTLEQELQPSGTYFAGRLLPQQCQEPGHRPLEQW
jgi:hypothetical protein